MDFNIKSGNPEKQRTACLIVAVTEPRKLSPSAAAIDTASKKAISNLIRKGDITGKSGQSQVLHHISGTISERIIIIGCGKERELDESQFRKIIANSYKVLKQTGAGDAMSYLTELNVKGRDLRWKIRTIVEYSEYLDYEFSEFKSKKTKARKPLKRITLAVPSRKELPTGEQAIEEGRALAKGITLTRDVANRPPNICTPTHLAEQAEKLAKTYKKIKTTVLEETEMKKLGMNSLLSVSQGSAQPGKLIIMEYRGGDKDEKPVVYVGKGVTFDSGGISIKPSPAMDEMKYDMCGAASVLGTVNAVAEMDLPMNVIGMIPAVENMPSSTATRPGDIYQSMSGQTIEVLNTDAEGRLILCDAITYSERYEPDVVVDIATLTGACVIALGNHATGLMSNHNPLANDLLNAGEEAGDRAWQLPMWDEYDQQLASNFADMANIGGRNAGTITAACFLGRFAKKMRWAHLDIAGTAWLQGKSKGATGRPVGLLVQYLLNRVKESGKAKA